MQSTPSSVLRLSALPWPGVQLIWASSRETHTQRMLRHHKVCVCQAGSALSAWRGYEGRQRTAAANAACHWQMSALPHKHQHLCSVQPLRSYTHEGEALDGHLLYCTVWELFWNNWYFAFVLYFVFPWIPFIRFCGRTYQCHHELKIHNYCHIFHLP